MREGLIIVVVILAVSFFSGLARAALTPEPEPARCVTVDATPLEPA